MQAILLAAGMGSRLGRLTAETPKCMVPVGGRTIIERALIILKKLGVQEVVIVTGYKHDVLEEFVRQLNVGIPVRFIRNDDFATTNNIVSLWLAHPAIRSNFFLLESDVLFSGEMLESLVPGCSASLSPFESWMNGTVVTLDAAGTVSAMYFKNDPKPAEALFKTVNLYHFDHETWQSTLWPRLDQAVQAGMTDVYYETIFGGAIKEAELKMRGCVCPPANWHEVDTPEDLLDAQSKSY